MCAILPAAALLVGLAACDSPTAPAPLNPQPLPPGLRAACVAVKGLYEPPDPCTTLSVRSPSTVRASTTPLNPQPLPPGLRFSVAGSTAQGLATTSACTLAGTAPGAARLATAYQPPDPCFH